MSHAQRAQVRVRLPRADKEDRLARDVRHGDGCADLVIDRVEPVGAHVSVASRHSTADATHFVKIMPSMPRAFATPE